MKFRTIAIAFGIILFLAIVTAFSFSLIRFLTVDIVSRPSIEFHQPLYEDSLPMSDMLVRFIARDNEGIRHVELWVDGELVAAQKSALKEGSNPFPYVGMWLPDAEGTHTLTARAYNTQNHSSTASVIVQVGGEPVVNEIPPDLPLNVESPEVPLPEDDEGPLIEEEDGPDVPVLMIDPTIIVQPLDGFLSDPEVPFISTIPRINLTREIFPRSGFPLVVEALYLEVDRTYDGVFCFVSLAGSDADRIPLDDRDYLTSGPGNLWDIKQELAGENKRTIYLESEADALDVYLDCWGADFDAGAVYDLGALNVLHFSEDWDGHLIEKEVIGPSGWFHVGYQIYPPESPPGGLPAPDLSYSCFESPYTDYCDLIWYYPEPAREEIDGFIITLNDELLLQKDGAYRGRWTLDEVFGSLPTCGRTYRYQVIAYKDDPILGERSPASNTVAITGDPCYYAVEVQFDHLFLFCLNGDYDTDCTICIHLCGKTCGLDPDDFDSWVESAGPDVPFPACFDHYMGSNWDQRLDYDEDMGCSYGKLSANGESVSIGEMGPSFGYCIKMPHRTRYQVSDYSVGGKDTVRVPLEAPESLIVGMNWYDDDSWTADDLQCSGEFTYYPSDLEEIASLPGRKKTYTRLFSEGGGGVCALQYTVKAFIMTPPSE